MKYLFKILPPNVKIETVSELFKGENIEIHIKCRGIDQRFNFSARENSILVFESIEETEHKFIGFGGSFEKSNLEIG